MHRIQPQYTANPTLFIVRRHDKCLKNLTFVVADTGPSLPIRNTRVDQAKNTEPVVCEHLTATVWGGQMAGCLYQVSMIKTHLTVIFRSLGAGRAVVWATTRRPPHERGDCHRDFVLSGAVEAAW